MKSVAKQSETVKSCYLFNATNHHEDALRNILLLFERRLFFFLYLFCNALAENQKENIELFVFVNKNNK